MSSSAPRQFPMSRRTAIQIAAVGLAAAILPSLTVSAANADEVLFDIADDTTVGDVLRALHPEHWATIDPCVQRVLNEAPYGFDCSNSISRVSGSVTLRATDGVGSSYFEGTYRANEVCPMVACYVTYSKNGAVLFDRGPVTAEYTSWVSISGNTTTLSPGTYRAVITGYPIQPPPGGSIEYSQRAVTVTIH